MCQSETYAKCTLTVPEDSLDSYRQANGWSSFSTIEEETSSSAICV